VSNIPFKIKELVNKRRFTQIEFAEKIGKTKQTVNNYLTGRTKIDTDTLEQIAKVLQVPVALFFEEKVTGNVTKNYSEGGQQYIALDNSEINNYAEKGEKDIQLLKQKIAHLEEKLQEKNIRLDEKDKQLEQKDKQLEQKDKMIEQLMNLKK